MNGSVRGSRQRELGPKCHCTVSTPTVLHPRSPPSIEIQELYLELTGLFLSSFYASTLYLKLHHVCLTLSDASHSASPPASWPDRGGVRDRLGGRMRHTQHCPIDAPCRERRIFLHHQRKSSWKYHQRRKATESVRLDS